MAVVGAGRMGRRHAQAYARSEHSDLVAVVDADADRAAIVAEECSAQAFDSVDNLLKAFPNLQAVSVAVPTQHHLEVASKLLTRGLACLIEKPLAPTVEASQQLVALAQRRGALLQVGHTERFNPAVRAVSALGLTPRFIEVDRISPMTFRSLDVGVVMDLMIHDLDIVLMLAQSTLRRVDAVGVTVLGEHEDVANARLVFDNGCVANLTASRLALKTHRKLRVFSESTYVSLDYQQRSGVVIRRSANEVELDRVRRQIELGADLSDLDYSELVQVDELTMDESPGQADPLSAQLCSFLSAVRNGDAVEVDGRAGAEAVDAAQRVVRAIAEHAWEGLAHPRV